MTKMVQPFNAWSPCVFSLKDCTSLCISLPVTEPRLAAFCGSQTHNYNTVDRALNQR